MGTFEVRGLSRDRGTVNPGLSVSFRIERTKTKTPNTAEIQVLNLADETRRQLQALKRVPVKLEAGYRDQIATIFLGELRIIESTWVPPEWRTVVRSGDGEYAARVARIDQVYDGRVRLSEAIEAVAKAMRVGIGNATLMAAKGRFIDGSNTFLQSAVLSGAAADVLDDLLESAGLEWSVQDNELQVLERGQPIRGQDVLLTPDTGLLSARIDTKNVVTFRSQLHPDIRPGVSVKIEAKNLTARMRVAEAVYIGDTAANDWYVDGKGKAL